MRLPEQSEIDAIRDRLQTSYVGVQAVAGVEGRVPVRRRGGVVRRGVLIDDPIAAAVRTADESVDRRASRLRRQERRERRAEELDPLVMGSRDHGLDPVDVLL